MINRHVMTPFTTFLLSCHLNKFRCTHSFVPNSVKKICCYIKKQSANNPILDDTIVPPYWWQEETFSRTRVRKHLSCCLLVWREEARQKSVHEDTKRKHKQRDRGHLVICNSERERCPTAGSSASHPAFGEPRKHRAMCSVGIIL